MAEIKNVQENIQLKEYNFCTQRRFYAPVGIDVSNSVKDTFKLQREGNGVKLVSTGKVDIDQQIQSMKSKAGLEYIKKSAILRFGSLKLAQEKLEPTKLYADISDIPNNIGDQMAYVKASNKKMADIASSLGLSVADFAKMDSDALAKYIKSLQTTTEKEVKADAE